MTYQLQLSAAPYPFETGVIYKLTAPNDKEYVGQSVEYENRMKEHKRSSGGCRKLNASIKKYGFPNFNREILAENLMAGLELDSAEIYYISYHNTQSPNGLNLKSGGAGGRHSEETKQLLRKPRSSRRACEYAKAQIAKKQCVLLIGWQTQKHKREKRIQRHTTRMYPKQKRERKQAMIIQ